MSTAACWNGAVFWGPAEQTELLPEVCALGQQTLLSIPCCYHEVQGSPRRPGQPQMMGLLHLHSTFAETPVPMVKNSC